MKKALLLLITGGLLATHMADANDQTNLEKLLKDKGCPGCSLVNETFEGLNLDGFNLEKADLQKATFIYEEKLLPGSEIETNYTSLKGANLKGAKLQGTRFIKVDLSNADFSGATFDVHTEFIDCTLTGAKMSASALTFKNAKGKSVTVKGTFSAFGKPKFADIDKRK